MANHKSAKKRVRQSLRKQKRNSQTKRAVKSYEKKLVSLIGESKKEESQTVLKGYVSKITKASVKGVLTKNHASRKISQLSKAVNNLG